MNRLRRFLAPALLFLACLHQGRAQTLQLKDGKVLLAKEIRREGNFLFLKVATLNGEVGDELVQVPQLERVDFGEQPALVEARQLAQSGDAAGVLEKTSQPADFFRAYADLPGSPWPDVMRLRLPALAAALTGTIGCDAAGVWTLEVAFGTLSLPAGGLSANGRAYAGASVAEYGTVGGASERNQVVLRTPKLESDLCPPTCA
jgi:hypothetical protein